MAKKKVVRKHGIVPSPTVKGREIDIDRGNVKNKKGKLVVRKGKEVRRSYRAN